MSEKCVSTPPSACQGKNQRKFWCRREVRCNKPTEKGERIVDTWHNVRFAHSSVYTIHGNAVRITENSQKRTKVFVLQDYHSPIGMNHTKNYGCESYIFIALEINIYIVWKLCILCIYTVYTVQMYCTGLYVH